MGSADIVPGVSGGTVALITGIYERLIYAIKSVDFIFIPYFFRGLFDRKYLTMSKKKFLDIDFYILLPLGAGVAVAFLLLANVLGFFLDFYPTYTYAFFFGLIMSSSFFVYKSLKNTIKITSVISIFIGIFFGYLIVGLDAIQTEHSIIVIFLSGIITFCAMILPGLSGAFILLILGQYDFMLGILRGLTHFEWANLPYAIAYILGGIVGLLGFARVLSFLIKNYRLATLSFILGLMIGALRKPGEFILTNSGNMLLTVISVFFGIFIVLIVSYYEFYLHKKTDM
jgi:putative membrane protein